MRFLARWHELLVAATAVLCIGSLVALSLSSVKADAKPTVPVRKQARVLARSPGTRPSTVSSLRYQSRSANPSRPVTSLPPTRTVQQPPHVASQLNSTAQSPASRAIPQKSMHQPQQPALHAGSAPGAPQASLSPQPPPPAYPYQNAHARDSAGAAAHGQSYGLNQAAAPLTTKPSPTTPQTQATRHELAGNGGGPSLARTALTTAVGAAVGSMVGNAVSNSLMRRPVESGKAEASTTDASEPDTVTPSTAAASTETESTREPLESQATVELVFPGVAESELLSNLRGAQVFGAYVQDAIVRALGVSSDRVVLKSVTTTPGSGDEEPMNVVVTVSLLPDERLLATEPTAKELAEEISRQMVQETSYLRRQLRSAFPQLSTAGVTTTVELSSAAARAAHSGSNSAYEAAWMTLLATLSLSWKMHEGVQDAAKAKLMQNRDVGP
ncbi:cell wall protein RBR3 [Cyclospora cayetanensis]|uniref:Cell wall protein RBR3 n=1 Tax=Cyclospora cayetanensis TaxID=88456 RepID=A0A6P6RXZ8_9EIME|nr:cell wall protein RBR3 [Cyclospora cayetanensis]